MKTKMTKICERCKTLFSYKGREPRSFCDSCLTDIYWQRVPKAKKDGKPRFKKINES